MFYFDEHTSDIKIKINADNFCLVLSELCKAINKLVSPKVSKIQNKDVIVKHIKLKKYNFSDIAVAFGNELIYLMDTEFITPYKVEQCSIEKDMVYLSVVFIKNKPRNILKAATYHNIKAKEDYLEIIFDI